MIFPCVIKKEDSVFYVDFPNMENVFTDGDTLEEAILNAKDVLKGHLFTLYKNGLDIPKPIEYKAKKDEMLFYIDIWEELIKDKVNNQSVKKTLTIPKWLNDIAEKNSVNFSNVLQHALKKELGL